ncbi:MAG: hypothetical protein ACRCU3_08520 [Eubacteriaceae bacterium]
MKKKCLLNLFVVLAFFFCNTVYAIDLSLTPDTPGGDMEVTANILAPDAPSYIVTIPAKVDFGTLEQPTTADGPNYKTIENIAIKASNFTNINSGQGVVVLAKGSGPSATFTLTNQTKPSISLNYEYLDPTGKNMVDNKLYDNGHYVFFFASESTVNTKLQLDQQQLYKKNLADYAGSYSGKITFYTKVVNLSDYQ